MTTGAAESILRYNEGRDPERLRLKIRAMRDSAFAFFRGSCHLFYERLPLSGLFETAPPAWVCGDLHLENFGSFMGRDADGHYDNSTDARVALVGRLLRGGGAMADASTAASGTPVNVWRFFTNGSSTST